MEMKVE